ncbi:phosphoesterase, partial [Streptococcus pyogenes]
QEENFKSIDFSNRTLLAFHGWYDYSFSEESQDTILRRKNLWFDRRLTRKGADQDIFDREIQQLEEQLKMLDTKQLIVSMHFVPHS